jgi:hypothetical protein
LECGLTTCLKGIPVPSMLQKKTKTYKNSNSIIIVLFVETPRKFITAYNETFDETLNMKNIKH